MKNKVLCLLSAIALSAALLSGCAPLKQIDKAALAETVAVSVNEKGLNYTFYLLDDTDKVNSITVYADSLKKAYNAAKEKYIPNLSLVKFELFLINEKIYNMVIADDLKFIATQYYLSPLSYVALTDDNTLKMMLKNKDAPQEIEKHIILMKNENHKVCTNSISVFNSIYSNFNNKTTVAYISSINELKAERRIITAKK